MGPTVEFDAVFTTTTTPPWCVLVCEYVPPANSSMYRNRVINEYYQAYMDIAAEAEFAWYVSVVPPYDGLTYSDLASADRLHPNNMGEMKWTSYIQGWITDNVQTYWAGPLPRPRHFAPYDQATGLGSRMGYY
jgi:hypothetical protein